MKETLVAVIGAGTIGLDVALDLALHDYPVLLKDMSDDVLADAGANFQDRYRFIKLMGGPRALPPLDDVLTRIETTTDYQRFAAADIVIENIIEDVEAKQAVYLELGGVCGADTMFGVNTSCIPIAELADRVPVPENVIGMHFMNPVPLSQLVEIARGAHTSDDTVRRARALVRDLGKRPVVVHDSPGFVTNRVMMLTINESIWVLHDEVADAKAVDTIFRLGFGHKMGPLATADLIGLDTILHSLSVLYDAYEDPKFLPCPLLEQMVASGELGRKSGKGFFTYGPVSGSR